MYGHLYIKHECFFSQPSFGPDHDFGCNPKSNVYSNMWHLNPTNRPPIPCLQFTYNLPITLIQYLPISYLFAANNITYALPIACIYQQYPGLSHSETEFIKTQLILLPKENNGEYVFLKHLNQHIITPMVTWFKGHHGKYTKENGTKKR